MNTHQPLKLTCFFRVISVLMLSFILILPAGAQPSGGPYGPVRQSWPLLFVWQRKMLCDRLKEPQFAQIDHNVYEQNPGGRTLPQILWSPAANDNCIIALDSPAELNKLYPQFSAHSLFFTEASVYKSSELGNYQPLPSFPGLKAASPLPDDISAILKRPKKGQPYIGAYPL
jgi:hypothetical protein